MGTCLADRLNNNHYKIVTLELSSAVSEDMSVNGNDVIC